MRPCVGAGVVDAGGGVDGEAADVEFVEDGSLRGRRWGGRGAWSSDFGRRWRGPIEAAAGELAGECPRVARRRVARAAGSRRMIGGSKRWHGSRGSIDAVAVAEGSSGRPSTRTCQW